MVGLTGAGKSSVMEIISGRRICKDNELSGEIYIYTFFVPTVHFLFLKYQIQLGNLPDSLHA